ncbi:hypothetical protein [Salicibibacter halophilus]|uniref:hypothetical protein n=1 Tax=Salicibibacter halophilus TaxID=2502791 RepID=UPI00135A5E3C|nr:hypothetical protein [Salicibibacter halophilus]
MIDRSLYRDIVGKRDGLVHPVDQPLPTDHPNTDDDVAQPVVVAGSRAGVVRKRERPSASRSLETRAPPPEVVIILSPLKEKHQNLRTRRFSALLNSLPKDSTEPLITGTPYPEDAHHHIHVLTYLSTNGLHYLLLS